MFSIFGKKSGDDSKTRARETFEKVAGLKSDSREARSARIRLGLLCRGHIDKTFIDGAEKTATWQEQVSAATARGKETPPLPEASAYQTLSTGSGEVTVYLPEDLAQEIFLLGARYQKAELSGQAVIEAAQTLADHLFLTELRLDKSSDVLQFLRAEVSEDSGEAVEDATTGA